MMMMMWKTKTAENMMLCSEGAPPTFQMASHLSNIGLAIPEIDDDDDDYEGDNGDDKDNRNDDNICRDDAPPTFQMASPLLSSPHWETSHHYSTSTLRPT